MFSLCLCYLLLLSLYVTMAIFLCDDWLSVVNKEGGEYDQFTMLLTQCGELRNVLGFGFFFSSEKKKRDRFM